MVCKPEVKNIREMHWTVNPRLSTVG